MWQDTLLNKSGNEFAKEESDNDGLNNHPDTSLDSVIKTW